MSQNTVIQQSMKEYQVLFLYRPEDFNYWEDKKKKGLNHCYFKKSLEFNPWIGEQILKTYKDVSLNIQDDTFKTKFKKMRVAKRAPNSWNLYFTSERIIATIPYGKTLKIGDLAELFKNTFKKRAHKDHYVVTHLPHSMLAGIVLRIPEGKPECKQIALVYKHKKIVKNEELITNYTLFFFDFGTANQAEKFGLKLKHIASNLQMKVLPLVKDTNLVSEKEMNKIKAEITANLHNNKYESKIVEERFKNYIIKTLLVGGIPFPIFPRENCNKSEFKSSGGYKFNR